MPLGVRIMQLCLELINLTIPSNLTKILIGHTLCMVMSKKSFLNDMPEPLGEAVITTTTMDANLNHCLATVKSLTGCLHFVNKTPVDWYSKNQATVETATYGSEFVAAKTATEQIMDIRQTLRYLGAPIGAKSFLIGDNISVVTSATLPHSTLTKRHNILAFHRVREAIAAKLMAFYWIQSAYNLSDMLSKHWDHPTVYPMILKLLITRGTITLIPKEATQEKENENLKLQPEKLKRKKKNKKIRKKMINTPTTRGEQQKNNHDISLSILL